MAKFAVIAVVLIGLSASGCAKSESAENVANEMHTRPQTEPPKIDESFNIDDGINEVQSTNATNNSASQ